MTTLHTDAGTRALYSMDASNHRLVPAAVAVPRTVDDLGEILTAARAEGLSVTLRGGGTSVGGQAVGPGLVIDTSRHLNRVLEIDPTTRTARVEPGVVLDDLNRRAAAHGLTFGPDPSTHSRCTLGGMIGNDACGPHSVAWGRTSANVQALKVLTYDGSVISTGPHGLTGTGRTASIVRDLTALADNNLALLRTGFPQLPRRVSGYALDRLLPENGRDVTKSLVGTEGTCAVLLEATVDLVELPTARALAVLGFPDETAAADAVPALLPHRPLTLESLTAELVRTLSGLPPGGAWLFAETGGDSPEEAEAKARTLASYAQHAAVLTDPAAQRALWRIREAAAGTASRMPDGSEAWPGWEDTAVPPEHLGDYLRDFRHLLKTYGLRGFPYGHFGEGCIHVRIDFDLITPPGVAAYREFSAELSDLVVSHGGSLSGEHGDGRARAEFLPKMYAPEMLALFARYKAIWDPDDRMNPGVLVRPQAVDKNLRFVGMPTKPSVSFTYPHDKGDLSAAVRRCVGAGKCRDTTSSGVMCPSFRATGEEKHSTRGRARLLHEMLIGDTVADGWRSSDVHDALDLCLSCKGCRSDCPVDVDMATYKAEFLHHYYRGRVRPLPHYALGFLPVWAGLVGAVPGASRTVNSLAAPWMLKAAGLDPQRAVPKFAYSSFTRWFRGRRSSVRGPKVVLGPDTFTNHFTPSAGIAAVEVLEAAGFTVLVPPGPVCCGLTWVSTGQLGIAKRVMRRTHRVLDVGLPIVALEPSCASALRTDLPELLGVEPLPVQTFAQTLESAAWQPPRIDRPVTGQLHCHQHATFGDAADRRLRAKAGLVGDLAGGCCGLAGNFGFEAGHREVSLKVAEDRLLPELAAHPDALVLADGFSCRTQIGDLTDRRAVHLAEVLAARLVRVRRSSRSPLRAG